MDFDKFLEYLSNYKGKGYEIVAIEQWEKSGERNLVMLSKETELNMQENPYDKKSLTLWVEHK